MLVLAVTENKIKEPFMVLHTEHIWDKIKRNRVQKGMWSWIAMDL